MKVWKLFILSLVSLSAVSTQQSCITPSRASGYCVPILECSWYVNNIRKFGQNRQPRAFVNYLRKSECFVENVKDRHMCCNFLDVSQKTSTTTTTTTPALSTAALNFKSLADYTSGLNPKGVSILSETKCGFIEGKRVAYGNNTLLFEFPFMALLRYDTVELPFKCGGSLITDKYVLTAAHCILTDLKLIGVRLGEWDLTQNPDIQVLENKVFEAPPVEDFDIAKKIPHPNYNKYFATNDVALIKLESSVNFKQHIQPICLPITQQSIDEPQTEFFIAGWGTTENKTTATILQKAKVAYQPVQVCRSKFQRDSINENIICAGGTNNMDSCTGDSGGPLFFAAQYRLIKRFVQFGIVSFGVAECGREEAFPGIYTNVVRFMPWITSNID